MPETQQGSPTQMYIYLVSLCSCALNPDIGLSVLRQAASLQLPNDFVVREEHRAHLIMPVVNPGLRSHRLLRQTVGGALLSTCWEQLPPQGYLCSATRNAHAGQLITCKVLAE